jgi:hypothetical protein
MAHVDVPEVSVVRPKSAKAVAIRFPRRVRKLLSLLFDNMQTRYQSLFDDGKRWAGRVAPRAKQTLDARWGGNVRRMRVLRHACQQKGILIAERQTCSSSATNTVSVLFSCAKQVTKSSATRRAEQRVDCRQLSVLPSSLSPIRFLLPVLLAGR